MSTEKNQTAAPSLVGQLDAEYVQAAQGDRAQRVQELRAIAAKAKGKQEIYPNTLFWVVFLLIVGIPLSLICLYKLGEIVTHLNDPHFVKDWKFVGALAFLGFAPLIAAVVFARNTKKPWLTFTEQGLSGSYLVQPLPWTAIKEYGVVLGEYYFAPLTVTLNLYLHEGAERLVVQKNGKPLKRPSLVFITNGKIRGMNGNKFTECFQTWWHAGLARAELAQMGED